MLVPKLSSSLFLLFSGTAVLQGVLKTGLFYTHLFQNVTQLHACLRGSAVNRWFGTLTVTTYQGPVSGTESCTQKTHCHSYSLPHACSASDLDAHRYTHTHNKKNSDFCRNMYIMLMSQAHSVCNRHWDLMMRQTVPLLRRHLWFSSQCWLTVKLCETHKAAFSKPAWNVQLFSVACKKPPKKKTHSLYILERFVKLCGFDWMGNN